MKLAVVAVLALGVLVVALFAYWGNSGDWAPIGPDVTNEPNGVMVDSEEIAGFSTTKAVRDVDVVGVLKGERDVVDEPTIVQSEAKRKRQAGRVILMTDDGRELSDLEGRMELGLWHADPDNRYSRSIEVGIRMGGFEINVTGVNRLSVESLVVDGRGAVTEPIDEIYKLGEEGLVVRARWTKPLKLNVLNAATGEHLENVVVAERRSVSGSPRAQHPGEWWSSSESKIEGDSPITIETTTQDFTSKTKMLFAYSEGFAWNNIQVDTVGGGERDIRLEPSGSIEINLVGNREFLHIDDLGWGPELRLYEEDSVKELMSFAEWRAITGGFSTERDAPIEIEGLSQGSYFAVVQFHDRVLGQTLIEVNPGEHLNYDLMLIETVAGDDEAEDELEIDDLQKLEANRPDLVDFKGTIAGLSEWGISKFKLKSVQLSYYSEGDQEADVLSSKDMNRVAGIDGEWEFDFGKAWPGDYKLKLSSKNDDWITRYVFPVKLPEGGGDPLELNLPKPARVVVRLKEFATGEDANVEAFNWRWIAESTGELTYGTAKRNEGESSFEFVTPPGKVLLESFATEGWGAEIFSYDQLEHPLEVVRGRNEFCLLLHRHCKVQFQFLHGATHLPPQEWWPEVEHLEGTGKLISKYGCDLFTFDDPGIYLVDMPVFEGFEPIPRQLVSAERGSIATHAVQLTKAK